MSDPDVTTLLQRWVEGDPDALGKLMPLVFDDLRRLAIGYFDSERAGHTLQPTALVNEVYLHFLGRRQVNWQNRAHFFGSAAQLMRRLLVSHARNHNASKRGSGQEIARLDEALAVADARDLNLVALDDALNALATENPEASRVVELRFFFGLTYPQISEILDVPVIRVRRQWQTAKLWLHRELKKSS